MSTSVKAKVENTRSSELSVSSRTAFVIAKSLEDFTNINTNNIADGSMLVYNLAKENWDAVNVQRNQNIDAGEF